MSQAESLVVVDGVSFSYDRQDGPIQTALDDVSLTIRRGELIGLVGQNGSGKSTLARHLNGLLLPDAGRVLVGDVDTRETEPGRLAGTVGYVFQNPDHALFLPTVREEIAYGLQFQALDESEAAARASTALAAFGLTQVADKHPASFGRGTRRLIVLAAAYAMAPALLVLDEPTGGLDYRLTSRLVETLRAYIAAGNSVVLISHDMQLVANTCDRVLALSDGRLIADGPPGRLFRDRDMLASTGLNVPDVARIAQALPETLVDPDTVAIDDFVEQFQRTVMKRELR